MSLTLYDIKKILNPKTEQSTADDFRIIDTWTEYEKTSISKNVKQRNLKYLCYQIETMDPTTGKVTTAYKAIKFLRIIRLPASAKQSTAFMDMQQQILSSIYEIGANLITCICNVIKPEPIGLLYLYGVQGVASDINSAKEIAEKHFAGLVTSLQGTFRVLEMRVMNDEECEWLKDKLYSMDYLCSVRGIPKANKGGEDAGNKGMGGRNLNPESQGTLEELITGMVDYEYVLQVLSTPVYMDTLRAWQRHSQRDMTNWYDHLQGQSGISFNLSIPMMYMANAGASTGWSKAYTDANSVNYSNGENYSVSQGHSFGQSYNHTVGTTQGLSAGGSKNISVGNAQGSSFGQNIGLNQGTNVGQSSGLSHGTNASTSHTLGSSQTEGFSQNQSVNHSSSANYSESNSHTQTNSASHSSNAGWSSATSRNHSSNSGVSSNNGSGFNVNALILGWNSSSGDGTSMGVSSGSGSSSGQTWGSSDSTSTSQGISESTSHGWGESVGYGSSIGRSSSLGSSESFSASNGSSFSENIGSSIGRSASQSLGNSAGINASANQSLSFGENISQSLSKSVSDSVGTNTSTSNSVSNGSSYSVSNGTSQSSSHGTSGTSTHGTSASMGLGPSIGYNRSHQWLNQGVKDLLELLEFQNERIKKALRGEGAFYTYVYIGCPSKKALAAAQAIAKSTWQNEFAMTNPLQVISLNDLDQKHLLYKMAAFSSDVTRELVGGVEEYRFATVLLPSEYVAYTHLPRVSEGGVFASVQDIPKFAVPSSMKGEIFMGTILSAERWSFENGYHTPFDYRLSEKELMHGFFTGASRSGKTVAALRFVAELAHTKRSKTGKRLRIVVMDPKEDWRTLARFVEPERFNFYSLGNTEFRPIKLNPFKVPYGVNPQVWIDGLIDIYCRAYGLLERGKQMMGETIYGLYQEAGVFKALDDKTRDWREVVPKLSSEVTFTAVYKRMLEIKLSYDDGSGVRGRGGNDTKDAYARLLDRLQAFERPYSVEHLLFGTSEGKGIDELIGEDDVTVFESGNLEKTFRNFLFGIITSGFYKYAKSREGGFLADDQYETILVIEEANQVLTGNDCAGSSGNTMGMSGESEFEEILDQSAGYGLFVIAITQKIADMPSSVIANSGLKFIGRLVRTEDVQVAVQSIGKEPRYEDRDLVKWFPRSSTGWFVCQSSRTMDFKDAEPVLVHIARLNINPPSNTELDEILTRKEISHRFGAA